MTASPRFAHQRRARAAGMLLAAAMWCVPGLVAAQGHGAHAGQHSGMHHRDDGGHMGGPHLDRMLRAVDATPEQKTRLTALAKAAQQDVQPLREQLQAGRKKGMALLAAPTLDRAALEKHRGEQAQLQDALSKRMLAHMTDAAEVLTPTQRAKLAEKMQARGERGHRMGRMPG